MPKQIIEIRTLIKKLGKKHTVILSSHILSEIQAVCDRVIIINKGRIAADDTTENLTENITADSRLIMRIDGNREEILKLIKTVPGVISVNGDMEREPGIYDYEIEVKEGCDIRRELFKRIVARNWVILGMRKDEMSLEDIFLKITMGNDVKISVKKSDKAADISENIDEPGSEEAEKAEETAEVPAENNEAEKEEEE